MVETDEVYLVCGHKGQPDKVLKAGRPPRRRRLKGARGRGTLEGEKPPVLGFIQRGGCLVLRLLQNVQQKTIKPIFETIICHFFHATFFSSIRYVPQNKI